MKKLTRPLWLMVLLALMAVSSSPATAFEQGDWLMRFGASIVDPKSNNHPVVSVDSGLSATFNFSYMMTDNLSVELLAAYPFEHDINLVDGPEVGDTSHLPPTLSVNYHFLSAGKFQPYVGVGLNYTLFFSESTKGALEGSDLSLDGSWGLAAQVGADIPINDKWFFNVNARYIDIETDATLDGADLGAVKIDPWVYGIHLGFKF